MNRVYLLLGIGLTATALVAVPATRITAITQLLLADNGVLALLSLGEVALLLILDDRIRKKRLATVTAGVGFAVVSLLNGIVIPGIFMMYSKSSLVLPLVAVAGTFWVMNWTGSFLRRDLSRRGIFGLYLATGLILALSLHLFRHGSMPETGLSVAGILLFAGLVTYDVKWLKNLSTETRNGDNIGKYTVIG
ncbi:MAG: Bax inhibitor-1 family protein, partial [Victivallales bacterium]|nr:Bax inhibitor-1 family protein [Victivallales bacterium]